MTVLGYPAKIQFTSLTGLFGGLKFYSYVECKQRPFCLDCISLLFTHTFVIYVLYRSTQYLKGS